MSFGGNSTKAMPAPPQKALGLDESRASTNEQARPLPYFAGKNRLGVTWITDAFGVYAAPVVSTVGKGQTAVSGYNYYANLAAVVCHGPVDAIEKIFFNGDVVWEMDEEDGPLERDGDIWTNLTLEGHALNPARLYWGTKAQNAGEVLGASGLQHPKYPGQCILYFDQVYFGFNQTNAPNVEVIMSRYPEWPWEEITVPVNIGGDCNPVAVICELLMSPLYGLGWDVSRLDQSSLLAVAAQLAEEEIGISPYITKQTSARQLIAQICEYFDGYPLITAEGKFSLGLMRAAADVEALPLIDEAVLTEEPELDTESWRGVKTKTWVKFNDRTREYKENALSYRAPGVAQLAGDNTPQTLERMWVTNPQFAQKLAAAAGRAAALPATGGSLSVRKSAALKPGDLFRFSYAHLGIEELVMRVVSTSLSRPEAREVSLEVVLDRAYLNDAYYLPEDDAVIEPVPTDPVPFTAQKLIELPRGLAEGEKITLSPLAKRPNFYTTGYNLHLRRTQSLATIQPPNFYQSLQWNFGARVVQVPVYNTYPIPTVDETYSLVVAFPNYFDPEVTDLAREYRLLWQFNGPGSSLNGGWMKREFMIVIGWERFTLPSDTENFYARVALLRGRRNSTPQTFYVGDYLQQFKTTTPMVTLQFDPVGEHNRFPLRGTLHQSYPATTDLIDLTTGLVVNFDEAFVELESPSLNNAFQNDLLVLAGEEIFSVAQVEYLSEGRYQLWGIRARYDTQALAHAAGEEVYVVRQAELKRLTHTSFQRNSAAMFKFQPKVLHKVLDLAQATTLTHRFTDRVHQPLCPVNLRAQGDGHSPYVTASATSPITLTWTLRESAPRDFWARWHDNPAKVNAATILEFLTLADELRYTSPATAAGATSAEYTKAQRETHFGAGPVTFKVRAYAFENGLRSRYHNELIITVI